MSNQVDIYLSVDHDHATGKVRALLCVSCNQMVGADAGTVDRLRKAVAYVDEYK